MKSKFTSHLITKHEKKLRKKARKMSNEELRFALWEVRKKSENNKMGNSEEWLIKESIYSNELKKRELLEWALYSYEKK